jgi:hypothetical protein
MCLPKKFGLPEGWYRDYDKLRERNKFDKTFIEESKKIIRYDFEWSEIDKKPVVSRMMETLMSWVEELPDMNEEKNGCMRQTNT